ncbi:MAG TPA: hypothetical protein VGJ30_21220 [Candidatus Angelobacter sp.]
MNRKMKSQVWSLCFLVVSLLFALSQLGAQQEKVAAFKQALARNQQALHQYQWLETTIISLKGEEKSRVQKQCFYGPDGSVQKQQISAPAPQEPDGRVRGRIKERKKEELTDYMQGVAALVHQYVPPDSQRIQATEAAGNLSLSPAGPGTARLDLHSYLKPGDLLSLNVDSGSNAMQKITVQSYMDSPKDAVSMNVTFAFLPSGISYPSNIVLDAPEKKIQVVVQNSNYQINPAAPLPAQAQVIPAARQPTQAQRVVAAPGQQVAPSSAGSQFPMLDLVASTVVVKYQQATCEQLWNQKSQPKSAREREIIQMLRNDSEVRAAFMNQVAVPVVNKMFDCDMVP